MMTDHHEINVLIAKCISGLASAQERTVLDRWIEESRENLHYFQQVKNIWDAGNREINPSDISVDAALERVERKISRRHYVSTFIGFIQKAAAILLLPLLVASFWFGKHNPVRYENKPVYSEVTAAFGTRYVLSLPDGSTVWLNSGSRLKYPHRFEGKERNVYLTGEGYFEVKANPKRPFIVHTRNLSITATGTRFNVNASGIDKRNYVTLVEGKVSVSRKLANGDEIQLAQMRHDEQLSYDTLNGNFSLVHDDTYKYIAWKDGKLIFRNEPLEDVLKKIGYYYNVDMELRGNSLKEYRYRATFEEESIDEILKLLKISSPVDYKVVKREPLPDGSFPKKKIIIFPVK